VEPPLSQPPPMSNAEDESLLPPTPGPGGSGDGLLPPAPPVAPHNTPLDPRLASKLANLALAAAAAEPLAEEEDEDEDEDPGIDLATLEALRQLHEEKEAIQEARHVARVKVEADFRPKFAALYAKRATLLVPGFWAQAMANHEALADMLGPRDMECLNYLADIVCEEEEDLLGFKLHFKFHENPFFNNAVLTKVYQLVSPLDVAEPLLNDISGTDIDWKPNMNLCERVVKERARKQRGRNAGQTKLISRIVRTDSFFKFFMKPVMTDDDYEEEEDEEDEADDDEHYCYSYQVDYEMALIFRLYLIPDAVRWYTGEAVIDDGDDEEEDEESEGEENDEDTEDDDDEDEDGGSQGQQIAANGEAATPECKQS
jgi:hypothetical protein